MRSSLFNSLTASSIAFASLSYLSACGRTDAAAGVIDSDSRDPILKEDITSLTSEAGIKLGMEWTKTFLDRSSNKPLTFTAVTKMEITAQPPEGETFAENAAIRVMVISKMWKDNQCGSLEADHVYEGPFELDLVRQEEGSYKASMFEGGFYFGKNIFGHEIKSEAKTLNLANNSYCEYHTTISTELAFVVNSEWQKDPINKTNNFKLPF